MSLTFHDKPVKGSKEWTGVHKDGTVELRKTFSKDSHYAQVLLVVDGENVTMSMNGKAKMSLDDALEMATLIHATCIATEAEKEVNNESE